MADSDPEIGQEISYVLNAGGEPIARPLSGPLGDVTPPNILPATVVSVEEDGSITLRIEVSSVKYGKDAGDWNASPSADLLKDAGGLDISPSADLP